MVVQGSLTVLQGNGVRRELCASMHAHSPGCSGRRDKGRNAHGEPISSILSSVFNTLFAVYCDMQLVLLLAFDNHLGSPA